MTFFRKHYDRLVFKLAHVKICDSDFKNILLLYFLILNLPIINIFIFSNIKKRIRNITGSNELIKFGHF